MVTSKVSSVQNGNSKSAQVKRQTEITVKSGETLAQIAKRYNMTPNEFMAWTGLKKSALNAGQKIALPNDTVPAGKGILALARKYGMTLDEFCKLNNISKTYSPAKGEAFYVKNHNKSNASSTAKTQPSETKAKPATQKPQATPKTIETKPKAKPKANTGNVSGNAAAGAKVATVTENKAKWGSSYTPQELADKIYEASKKYAAVGKPDFDALIDEINPKNAEEVLKAYTKKESLINTIVSEVGSKKDARKKAVMHVFDALSKEKNIPAAVRENFEKELNNQFNSIGWVSTKRLDKTITRMMQTPEQLAKEMAAYVDDHIAAVGDYDYQEMLSLVGSHNASQVVTAYNKISPKESLINAITSETGSSSKRKAAVMHIYDAIAKQKGASPNLRNQFIAELDAQFDKTFSMVDTEKLDNMINDMLKTKPKKKEVLHTDKYVSDGQLKIPDSGYIVSKAGITVQKHSGKPPIPVDSKGNVVADVRKFQPTKKGALSGKTIMVNAGHGWGGSNVDSASFKPGSRYKDKNGKMLEEWYKNRNYADNLIEELTRNGATVIYTTGDAKQVCDAKEKFKADVLISLHCNAVDNNPEVNGLRIIHDGIDSKASDDFAKIMEAQLKSQVNPNTKTMKAKETQHGYIGLIDESNKRRIPALMLEMGFMSNPTDKLNIDSRAQRQLSMKNVTLATMKYLGIDVSKYND